MTHIRHRSDLIAFAREHVPSRAIRRAFATGRVRNLGGFDAIPPRGLPGWILSVVSEHGRAWYVVVYAEQTRNRFLVGVLARYLVPWWAWTGNLARSRANPFNLFDGDQPQQVAALRGTNE